MISHSTNLALAVILCFVLRSGSAQKFVPIGVARASFSDKEFSFSFEKDALQGNVFGIPFQILFAPRHRLLGMPDVNVRAVRVNQPPQAVIPWHVHPRGSENYATIAGLLQLTITLEGTNGPRRVVSVLPSGHFSPIPQGIPHTVKCLSMKPCLYHIFFNSADPGFIFFDLGPNPVANSTVASN